MAISLVINYLEFSNICNTVEKTRIDQIFKNSELTTSNKVIYTSKVDGYLGT